MTLRPRQAEFKAFLKAAMVSPTRPLPYDELESKASKLHEAWFEDLDTLEIGEVLSELTIENAVVMARGDSIVDTTTFKPWIASRRAITLTPRWDAYKKELISRDWEPNVIRALDSQTDDIVELLGEPTDTSVRWPRRGLLMGEVQSGKTATYLGILNKALDYGYRVVVVIAGHTEELRQQTQARFDTDLLGVDSETWGDGISSAALRFVGVGKTLGLSANLKTTVRHDFSRAKSASEINRIDNETPTVFITKKTPSLLNNIRSYIKSQAPGGKLDIPMVVIDDESDWGSPNTRAKEDPTSVNKAIRALLDASSRSTYVAITATPFANIFIDDQAAFEFVDGANSSEIVDESPRTVLDDLFPSDYIRVMFPPSNYLGMATYFSELGHPAVNVGVEDCLLTLPISHKNHHQVAELPGSLKTAVVEFMLGTAVRRVRDATTKPAAMLINVSRFKSVERCIAELAEEYLRETVATVLAEFARDRQGWSERALSIWSIWMGSYAAVRDVSWDQVAKSLLGVVSEFRVDLVNGDTARDRTRRRKLMTVAEREADDLVPKIVVGGDVLSRGLTLDGLQVSYFVREPRTMDTLMQMGRWFGYRPGFDDLVRVWMPESTRASFAHSTEVTAELRDELLDMKARGLTPRDFGLRVRVHPDSVDIVAANKARDTAIVEIGPTVWQNRLAEAYDLTGDEEIDRSNRDAVRSLIGLLGPDRAVKTNGGFSSWRGVELDAVMSFFRTFQGDRQSQWFGRRGDGTLPITDSFAPAPGGNNWDVVLVSSGEGAEYDFGSGFKVTSSVRNKMGRSRADGHIRVDKRRVSTPTDLVRSLTIEDREAMGLASRVGPDGTKLSSQAQALAWLDHPVLMIYVVTADQPSSPGEPGLDEVEPGTTRVAVVIAFPRMSQAQIEHAARGARKYQVNKVFWRAYNGFVEDEGDDVATWEDS